MNRFAIGVVVEHHPVLIPAQTTGGYHPGHILVGVAPYALHIHQASSDIQHGPAGFSQITLMNESVRAQPFAAQTEHFAVCKGRCGIFVFESSLRPPASLRIVELYACHAVVLKTLPGRLNMFPEIRIGIVAGYQRLMMRMFDMQPGNIVEQHVAWKRKCVIVGWQSNLEIGEGDAAALLQRRTPLGKCFIRGNQMAVFRPVLIIPPPLFGVAVLIAIGIRLEANGNFGVFRDACLLPHLQLGNQRHAVVDVAESAQRTHRPSAQGWEIIHVGPRLVCRTHGKTVSFKSDERVRLCNIQVKIIL